MSTASPIPAAIAGGCARGSTRSPIAGRKGAPRRPYIVVEKILGAGERLSPDWGCDGTTGYDFMNEVSGVLHDPAGEAALNMLWASVSGRAANFIEEEERSRREMLRGRLCGTTRHGGLNAPPARARRSCGARRRRAGASQGADRDPRSSARLSNLSRDFDPADRSYFRRGGGEANLPSPRSSRGRAARRVARWREGRRRRRRVAIRGGAPIRAAQRAARRQGGRRHRLLPLRPAAVAPRRRLRRDPAGDFRPGVSRGLRREAAPVSRRDARYRDARPQARRGRARAARRPERACDGMGQQGAALDRDERAASPPLREWARAVARRHRHPAADDRRRVAAWA